MDSVGVNGDSNCNGNKHSVVVNSSREEAGKAEEEADGETKSLLQSAVNGGMAKKRQRSSRRRVQWNDRNGNKLVEVLEFQPSDSSDSEDESRSGDCIWTYAIAACIHVCCCLKDRRSTS